MERKSSNNCSWRNINEIKTAERKWFRTKQKVNGKGIKDSYVVASAVDANRERISLSSHKPFGDANEIPIDDS